MTAATQHTESSKTEEHEVNDVAIVRRRRLDDELRLRELELQTNFQIQTLSQSLDVLKAEFHSWRDSLNDKLTDVNRVVDSLKTRMTAVIVLLIAQMADAPALLTRLLGV